MGQEQSAEVATDSPQKLQIRRAGRSRSGSMARRSRSGSVASGGEDSPRKAAAIIARRSGTAVATTGEESPQGASTPPPVASPSSGRKKIEESPPDTGTVRKQAMVVGDDAVQHFLPKALQADLPANVQLERLPQSVLRCLVSFLSESERLSLARTCRVMRRRVWVWPLSLPCAPPVMHHAVDVVAAAARRVKRSFGIDDEAYLNALRVLLTQSTRFPRVRLASASFKGCGPHARALLEAVGLREEMPGYLSCSDEALKGRLSEGREALELLVNEAAHVELKDLFKAMLTAGAGSAEHAMQRALEAAGGGGAAPVVGAAESKGERDTCEDAMVAGNGWAAVFDGHGGRNAALLGAMALLSVVEQDAMSLAQAIRHIHRLIVRLNIKAGSTVVLAQMNEHLITVAWLGDCRAVLVRQHGQCVVLSEDHRPSNPREARRVTAAGGRITTASGQQQAQGGGNAAVVEVNKELRINGELAVSRALGDCDYERWGLIHEPEVSSVRRTLNDEFIVLACDGLWDVLSNEEVTQAALTALRRCTAIRREQCLQHAASYLVQLAVYRGASDNISVLLLDARMPLHTPPPLPLPFSYDALVQVLLVSPFTGVPLRRQPREMAFNAPALLDALQRHVRHVSRHDALLMCRHLQLQGVLVPLDQHELFQDDDGSLFTLEPQLLARRLRLGHLPCARRRGAPLHHACPVCYMPFSDPKKRVQHLWNRCAPLKLQHFNN